MRIGIILCFFLCLKNALTLNIPENNCQHFRYVTWDRKNYYGIVTAPRADLTTFNWKVKFSIKGVTGTVGKLQPYPSMEKVFANVQNRIPIQTIVQFNIVNNALPKLTLLQLNGATLCSNTECEWKMVS
ncbi:hypothetical protein KR009_012257 [Drosophila setifemur]|nr:hypothetical protein KR009_012257 [Drosophila setifemur]